MAVPIIVLMHDLSNAIVLQRSIEGLQTQMRAETNPATRRLLEWCVNQVRQQQNRCPSGIMLAFSTDANYTDSNAYHLRGTCLVFPANTMVMGEMLFHREVFDATSLTGRTTTISILPSSIPREMDVHIQIDGTALNETMAAQFSPVAPPVVRNVTGYLERL